MQCSNTSFFFHYKKSEFYSCVDALPETKSLLALDFDFVRKMLSSSSFNINSEVEVFTAADSWISHCHQKRIQRAKDLLTTICWRLLSEPAIKLIFQQPPIANFCRVFKSYHLPKIIFIAANSVNAQTSRHCDQPSLEILTNSCLETFGPPLLDGETYR